MHTMRTNSNNARQEKPGTTCDTKTQQPRNNNMQKNHPNNTGKLTKTRIRTLELNQTPAKINGNSNGNNENNTATEKPHQTTDTYSETFCERIGYMQKKRKGKEEKQWKCQIKNCTYQTSAQKAQGQHLSKNTPRK